MEGTWDEGRGGREVRLRSTVERGEKRRERRKWTRI